MTAPLSASPQDGAGRRMARWPIAVPVRVTVVRSGTASAIPGRSLDLSEGGIATVLAAELAPGDPVGVEFPLPEMGLGVHARAIVRHHAALRSGLEFQSLSVEQRAMIRRWTHRAMMLQPTAAMRSVPEPVRESSAKKQNVVSITARLPSLPNWKSRQFLAGAAAVMIFTALLLWWHWQNGWQQLEAEVVSAKSVAAKAERISLTPGVVGPLLIDKVDPESPPGARKNSGAVVLRVVIGQDGTVIDQQAISGPEALARAAMDAVKYWRFEPYRVDGRPVEVETTLTIEFPEN